MQLHERPHFSLVERLVKRRPPDRSGSGSDLAWIGHDRGVADRPADGHKRQILAAKQSLESAYSSSIRQRIPGVSGCLTVVVPLSSVGAVSSLWLDRCVC